MKQALIAVIMVIVLMILFTSCSNDLKVRIINSTNKAAVSDSQQVYTVGDTVLVNYDYSAKEYSLTKYKGTYTEVAVVYESDLDK